MKRGRIIINDSLVRKCRGTVQNTVFIQYAVYIEGPQKIVITPVRKIVLKMHAEISLQNVSHMRYRSAKTIQWLQVTNEFSLNCLHPEH
jgi:hypothetical protein